MTGKEIRNWLGRYFLITTGVIGSSILLLGKGVLHLDDVAGTFQIIVPVLVGQLAIMFKWFSAVNVVRDKKETNLPAWVVKGPPFMVVAIMTVAAALKVVGFYYDAPALAPSDDQFKAVVTFCVAILNATTIYVIPKYFSET